MIKKGGGCGFCSKCSERDLPQGPYAGGRDPALASLRHKTGRPGAEAGGGPGLLPRASVSAKPQFFARSSATPCSPCEIDLPDLRTRSCHGETPNNSLGDKRLIASLLGYTSTALNPQARSTRSIPLRSPASRRFSASLLSQFKSPIMDSNPHLPQSMHFALGNIQPCIYPSTRICPT